MAATAAQIAAIRSFNRRYTRWLGLLDEHHLASGYTLTEMRVLYELAHRRDASAAELARDLGLDAGYLSRILKAFDARGLLVKTPAAEDARQRRLSLSAAGREAYAPLNRAAAAQLTRQLRALGAREMGELTAAMQRIESLLAGADSPAAEAAPGVARKAAPEPFILRPLRVGDIGWVAHRQGLLYAQEYGWDATFEALVAEIGATFVREFDPAHEQAWIAEREGAIVGSVFLVRKSPRVAQLRLLYVESSARGLGLGARLVDECLAFARSHGYRRMVLWTNDVLVAARRIYEARGFTLQSEERHHSFGKHLVGQYWALDLAPPAEAPKPRRGRAARR